MSHHILSRRRFILGSSAALASIPLFSRIPSAHAADFPTRLVVFFSPQEPINKEYWVPGPGFALQDVMSPLVPHKDKLLMIGDMQVRSGDDEQYAGHYLIGHILTNQLNVSTGSHKSNFLAGGISVDQYIAQKIGTQPLVLGVKTGAANGSGRLIYTGANAPVSPVDNPEEAFDHWFGNSLLSPQERDDRALRRTKVLDTVNAELSRVSSRLPAADRNKLEHHIERMRALEASLAGGSGGGSCPSSKPSFPSASGANPYYARNENIPQTTRTQIDIAAQALACGVTRVAAIQIGSSGGFGTPQWPAEGINISKDDHDIAHEFYSINGAKEISNRVALERYHYQQFAYLLQQMDSYQEGGGTLLDHSVVLWVKCMSDRHNHKKMMMMLAGGANGALTTGRYVSADGKPTANLLVNVINLMGIPDTSFGNANYCTGSLSL